MVQTPVEARNVIFSTPVHTGTGVYPPSYTIDMATVSRWYNSQTVTLITHPYVGPRLKVSNLYVYSPSVPSRMSQQGDVCLYTKLVQYSRTMRRKTASKELKKDKLFEFKTYDTNA